MAAPTRKRRRKSTEAIDLTYTERLISSFRRNNVDQCLGPSSKRLCEDRTNAIASMKLTHSNAAVGFGVPFPRATCVTERYLSEIHAFGVLFDKGHRLLVNLISDPDYIPVHDDSGVVEKLLLYLCDQNCKEFLLSLEKKHDLLDSNGQIAALYTKHIFSELAVDERYTLDIKNLSQKCQCGCNIGISQHFGNTNIGHLGVWHGHIDVLFPSSRVCLVVPESDVGVQPVLQDHQPADLEDMPVRSQMLAQTITFSFLQNKEHSNDGNTLIPCIGVAPNQIIFYFYDSVNDVLLQSRTMPLVVEKTVNYETVIALWLVLNHKQLGSGIPPTFPADQKAGFFELAEDKLAIYRNCLKTGTISGIVTEDCYNPGSSAYERSIFRWPEDRPKIELPVHI